MDGRKIANLLQEGYRMPKPQHVDDTLYVNMVVLLLVFGFSCLSFFCSGCRCTSRFNIFTCWTSLTKGNERRSTLSRVYNCVIYLFYFVIKERKFATKKACSSRIGWTVSKPPMTYQDIHNILVFQVWNNDEMLERRTQLKTIFWEVEKQTQRDGEPAQGRIKEFAKTLSLSIFFFWRF